VGSPWTGPFTKQAEYASVPKGCPGLIECIPGEPKSPGGLCDGPTILLDTAQHLVFDLHDIMGIEKAECPEDLVRDAVGVGV
jgi:hypothetical protein